MRITSVRTLLISEALDEPWQMGLGTAYKRDEVLVLVDTDEGVTGLGASYLGFTRISISVRSCYGIAAL